MTSNTSPDSMCLPTYSFTPGMRLGAFSNKYLEMAQRFVTKIQYCWRLPLATCSIYREIIRGAQYSTGLHALTISCSPLSLIIWEAYLLGSISSQESSSRPPSELLWLRVLFLASLWLESVIPWGFCLFLRFFSFLVSLAVRSSDVLTMAKEDGV